MCDAAGELLENTSAFFSVSEDLLKMSGNALCVFNWQYFLCEATLSPTQASQKPTLKCY